MYKKYTYEETEIGNFVQPPTRTPRLMTASWQEVHMTKSRRNDGGHRTIVVGLFCLDESYTEASSWTHETIHPSSHLLLLKREPVRDASAIAAAVFNPDNSVQNQTDGKRVSL